MQSLLSLKQALWLFVLTILWTLIVVLLIFYYKIQLAFAAEIVIHGGIILLIVLMLRQENPHFLHFSTIGFKKPTLRWLVAAMLTGLLLWLLDYANSVFIFHTDICQQGIDWLNIAHHEGFISSSIAVCLLAPLAEELLFRGVLLPALISKSTPFIAILTSSTLFSLIHFSTQAAGILFIAGIFFAILRTTSRNLWPPLLAHITNNTLTWSAYIGAWDNLLLPHY